MTGYPTHPHPAPPSHRPTAFSRFAIPVAMMSVAVVAVIIATATAGRQMDGIPQASTTPLQAAHDHCMVGDLVDSGHTLVIDMRGEELSSGFLSFSEVSCLLDYLETPDSVMTQMNSTRALDGMQDATWSGLNATWTYHPDDGLDIIITDN
ncbi:hypothetical protein [Actinophytocola sp. NPDC049390]|uniref:hypothetical protein n=1 Tax=Actinophytocola sp. NPDC049390 TaxID=3363894 RepID=UPI0037A33D1F